MNASPRNSRAVGPRSRARYFWAGFLLVLLLGILLALFAMIRGGQQWAEQRLEQANIPLEWKRMIQVGLAGGERIHIDERSLEQIRDQSGSWLLLRGEQMKRQLSLLLAARTNQLFLALEAGIPEFTDWYYSLGGEYARLFHALAGNLPDYMIGRMEQLVFEPAGFVTEFDRVLAEMDQTLASNLAAAVADYRLLLQQLLDLHQQQATQEGVRIIAHWEPALHTLDRLLPLLTASSTDFSRQGVSATAGAGVALLAAKKLGAGVLAKSAAVATAKPSAGLLAALGAKLGVKSAASGGSAAAAGAGAASGAALCTASVVGAPLAPACALLGGLVSGTATWMLVDKAILEADERLHRDAFEQQLRQALDDQRKALRAALEAHYLEAAETEFTRLRNGVAFTPAPEIP